MIKNNIGLISKITYIKGLAVSPTSASRLLAATPPETKAARGDTV